MEKEEKGDDLMLSPPLDCHSLHMCAHLARNGTTGNCEWMKREGKYVLVNVRPNRWRRGSNGEGRERERERNVQEELKMNGAKLSQGKTRKKEAEVEEGKWIRGKNNQENRDLRRTSFILRISLE